MSSPGRAGRHNYGWACVSSDEARDEDVGARRHRGRGMTAGTRVLSRRTAQARTAMSA